MQRQRLPRACARKTQLRIKADNPNFVRDYPIEPEVSSVKPNFETLSFLNMGISVAPSLIPNAGHGIFAQKCFQVGDVITEYAGTVLLAGKVDVLAVQSFNLGVPFPAIFYYEEIPSTAYGISAYGKCEDTGDAAGHKLNDPQDASLWNATTRTIARSLIPSYVEDDQNKYMDQSISKLKYRLFLVATKEIYPGQEIFQPYGMEYWKRADIYSEIPRLTQEQVETINTVQIKHRVKCDSKKRTAEFKDD